MSRWPGAGQFQVSGGGCLEKLRFCAGNGKGPGFVCPLQPEAHCLENSLLRDASCFPIASLVCRLDELNLSWCFDFTEKHVQVAVAHISETVTQLNLSGYRKNLQRSGKHRGPRGLDGGGFDAPSTAQCWPTYVVSRHPSSACIFSPFFR